MAGLARRLVQVEADAFRQLLRESGRRVLGIDVGSQRVGLAISEDVDGIALPLKVVRRKDLTTTDVSAFIKDVVVSHNIGGLVVGLPIDLDGEEGVSCRRVKRFVRQVSRETELRLPYTFYDETNTTVDAYDNLKDAYGPEYVKMLGPLPQIPM